MNPAIKYAAASLLLLVSYSSNSANLWAWGGNTFYSVTPQIVCESIMQFRLSQITVIDTPRIVSLTKKSDLRYECHIYLNQAYGGIEIFQIYKVSRDCPDGYQDDGTGQCIEISSCPVPGTKKYITSQPDKIPPSPINYDGCEYDFLLDESSTSCAVVDSGKTLCTFTYSSTGDPSTSPEYVPESSSDNFEPVQGLTDTVKTFLNSNTISGDPSISPDGTVTQTDVTTEVKTQDSGTKINEDDNFISIESSDGTVTTYTETETTVIHPDGTSTVTSNISSNFKTPKIDKTIIDKGTGVISTSKGSSTVIRNGDVTIINKYDTSGKLVSSEKSTTGTGKLTGTDDETKEGNCGAPGQPVCEVNIKDNSEEYADKMNELKAAASEFEETKQGILDEFNDAIDSAFDSIFYLNPANFLSKYFGYNLPSTCSGAIDTTIFGRPFYFSPCEKLQPIRDILAWSFFILTLLLCSKILFSRSPL